MSMASALSELGRVTGATRDKAEELWAYAASKGYELRRLWGIGTKGQEHPTGRALDLMITGTGLGKVVGDLLASYLWKNRKRLGVKWIIWDRHIRSTSPGKSGQWERYYGESPHTDHVHVFFGTAAYVPPPAGGGGGSKPTTKTVDLSQLIKAAKSDPDRKQGGTTPGASDDVKIVEAALKAEGLLSARYARDGSFGSLTVAAYSKWQESKAGGSYRGKDADGIPGRKSLERLGKRNGFKVVS